MSFFDKKRRLFVITPRIDFIGKIKMIWWKRPITLNSKQRFKIKFILCFVLIK